MMAKYRIVDPADSTAVLGAYILNGAVHPAKYKDIDPNAEPNDFLNWIGQMGFADSENALATARARYEWYKKAWACESMSQACVLYTNAGAGDDAVLRAFRDKEAGLPMIKPKWL